MSLDHQIGEKLRVARSAANLSCGQAAERLNISQPELETVERGAARAAASLLARAAREFNVEIRWFFDPSKDVNVTDEDKFQLEAASTSILQGFRRHKTLSKLCETVRESDYSGRPRKIVA